MARACGSYPQCPRFDSRCRHQIILWLTVKILPLKNIFPPNKRVFLLQFFPQISAHSHQIKIFTLKKTVYLFPWTSPFYAQSHNNKEYIPAEKTGFFCYNSSRKYRHIHTKSKSSPWKRPCTFSLHFSVLCSIYNMRWLLFWQKLHAKSEKPKLKHYMFREDRGLYTNQPESTILHYRAQKKEHQLSLGPYSEIFIQMRINRFRLNK